MTWIEEYERVQARIARQVRNSASAGMRVYYGTCRHIRRGKQAHEKRNETPCGANQMEV